MDTMNRKPYLVQRCYAKTNSNGHKGVDALLSFDYMGSSEFEFGALGTASRAMRKQTNVLETIKCDGPQKWKLFILTEPDMVDTVKKWVREEMAGTWYGKERAGLREAVAPTPKEAQAQYRPYADAWWGIDSGRPSWMVFRTKELAEAVQKEYKQKTPSKA